MVCETYEMNENEDHLVHINCVERQISRGATRDQVDEF
jgi:hypothetical protein